MSLLFLVVATTSFLGAYNLGRQLVEETCPAPSNVIHVFTDLATTPTLLQMITLTKTPPKDLKVIGWRRFKDMKNKIDFSRLNAMEIELFGETSYLKNKDAVFEFLQTTARIFPDKKFVFHTNMAHFHLLTLPILQKLSPGRVKEIHFYEDGHGQIARTSVVDPDQLEKLKPVFLTKEVLEKDFNSRFVWLTPFFFPTTYHLGFLDFLKQENRFKKLMTWVPARFEDVNFHTIGQTLSDDEKKLLFQMVEFNPQLFQSLKTGVLFTTSFNQPIYFDAKIRLFQAYHRQAGLERPLFFKQHPVKQSAEMKKRMKAVFPKMHELPAGFPFEIFLIAGVGPAFVAGDSSSLFFSVTNEQLLGYFMPGRSDSYGQTLENLGLLDPNKKVNLLLETQPKNALFYLEARSWDDWIVPDPENAQKVKRKSNNDKAHVVTQTATELTLKWDRWGEEKFSCQGIRCVKK